MTTTSTKNVGIFIDGTLFTHVIFLMGCAPSSQTKREKLIGNETNLMEAYSRVEHDIWQEEQQVPASTLAHAISKLEKITFDLEKLTADATQSQNHAFNQFVNNNRIYDIDSECLEDIDNSIKSIMTELRVANNPKQAAEHEEFIANLNKKALKCRQVRLLNRRKFEIEEEATKSSERVQNLQKLYEQQDSILSDVLGSSYSSMSESELDRLRNYRDTLYIGELAWQDAIKLTQSASVFSQVGFNSWQTISTSCVEISASIGGSKREYNYVPADESRFKLATETRNAIQEAALLIQSAQSLLPAVQFPYCTQREIYAVLQVIKYLYTDMQIAERYEHAKEVYRSFHKRSTALCKWLRELMSSTIHKDIEEVDTKISEFVSKLNSERIIQIKKKLSALGLTNAWHSAESQESLHNTVTNYPRSPEKRK